jgi:hypothetical protein
MIVGQDQSSLLDNPVWNALSTTHASFAEGDDLAKRYPVDVAPFAATLDQSPESYRSLARLLGPEGTAAIPLAAMPLLPEGWTVVRRVDSAQMVWYTQTPPPVAHSFEELSFLRVDEMLALVELTKPGPFLKRTPELGSYLGIREAGQLVAMAGERLKPYGYTEISLYALIPTTGGADTPAP